MNINEIISAATKSGFTAAGELDVNTLEFRDEVRDMCSADRCGSYAQNWTCPPACGTLDEIRARIDGYSSGVIMQTIAELEDEFDWEGMMAAGETHKKSMAAFVKTLKAEHPEAVPMGMGACTLCPECTYPHNPCRHPESAFPSMEAYGLLVSDVCERNNMKYNNGTGTITYTSAVVIK